MKKRELGAVCAYSFLRKEVRILRFSLSPCRRERNTCLYRGSDPGDQIERGKLQRRRISTVFLGGGTPSMLSGRTPPGFFMLCGKTLI